MTAARATGRCPTAAPSRREAPDCRACTADIAARGSAGYLADPPGKGARTYGEPTDAVVRIGHIEARALDADVFG